MSEKNSEVQTPREPDFTIRVGKKVLSDLTDFVLIARDGNNDCIRMYSSSLWADGACRQFRIDLGVAHRRQAENGEDGKGGPAE